jgi:chromosomal replication initiator protein
MQAWDNFLTSLENDFTKQTLDQWLRPLKIVTFDARNLYMEATDPLQISWFEEHIRPLLKQKFLSTNGAPIQVHFSKTPKTQVSTPEQPNFRIEPNKLDLEQTFATFLVSEENKIAFETCKNLSFNPIYIFGPKHSGKTHLLMGTALYLKELGKKVFYVRAETFTSHVVQAIRLGMMRQFRQIYREIDVLLIDDIDFLANKHATQEEFFHTFNTLQMIGKPILISAPVPPSQLELIEPRLMSRFEWGISLKIQAPPAKLLLQAKANLWKLLYSEEVIETLASTFPKEPLMALQTLSLRTKGPVTKEKALTVLSDLIEEAKTTPLSAEEIIAKTAIHFGIRSEDILGKSQAREHAQPRQIAMFLCREKLDLPFQKIGAIFGRDHSTVMSSVKHIQKQKENASCEALSEIEDSFKS